MKKLKWSAVLFVILVLLLSTGSAYLALNQVTNGKNSKGTQKMTVALVNEDQGASLNGKKIEFGNEFITSIEKDNTHDWYVVSRGVAESGLARNDYNLMIVIPNDFSQKALSIDSNAPEKVTLNYKINATGNNDVKVEAEKTASSILEEFNSQIIDVYFASIISNLQNAQDNIGKLVNKEQIYTDTYKDYVNNPLAGYTSQFKNVQDQTGVSKNSFKGFQDLLNGFNNKLNDGMKFNQAYQTAFSDFNKMKEVNSLVLKEFTPQLAQFDQGMNTTDVMQQLANLELANKMIYDQFQLNKNNANILSDSAAIQEYLNETKANMSSFNTDLANTLASDLKASLIEKLKKELSHSSDGHQDVYLNNFFKEPDSFANNKIQGLINQLPSLNTNDIQNLGFTDSTKKELENVIAITDKYNLEVPYSPVRNDNSIPLVKMVQDVKDTLAKTGVQVIDTTKLPATKNAEQVLTLNVPDAYDVTSVKLIMEKVASPSSKLSGIELDYTNTYLTDKKIVLPATDEGSFTIKAKLRLKDPKNNIDVFQPMTWSWNMKQEDTTAALSTYLSVGKTNATVPPISSDQIIVNNNDITHQVMSSLVADSTNLIIQNVDETIKNYHKLSNLYNLYFGLDVSANLPDDFSQSSLSNLAKSDSLYYLFNKSDMVDILAEYVANQTVEGVRQQTQDLKDKMDSYIQLINSVDQNSAHLADVIKQTTEQANSMNTNLAQTIKDLAAWREASRKLVGQQTKIMSNEDGEQTAILGLDGEFKSILVQSQSLADQSKSTLTSADDVYKTFDTIDNQAKTIQASGNELVNNAASLSDNLSKKLTEDKDFLRNFVKVLPNSRIGERQNENLFSFLANPVQTKNDGVVVADNRFTPYLLVLICFLVSLFTAYVISNQERKRIEENAFEEGKSLTMRNLPITSVQMGIGIVEGIVIGGISGYLLKISNVKFLIWMSIFIIIMLLLILVLGYLLRQMKMVGMFILLVILSLYLFLTDAVGQNLDKLSLAAKIRQFSPLQYIENLLTGFINGREDWSIILYGLVAAVIIGLIANLYVIHKYPKEGDEHEANTQTN